MTPPPHLAPLLGRRARVTVTNPHLGSSWTGRLLAYHEDPGVVIEPDSGPRMCLPASFTITEVPEPLPDEVTVSREDLNAVLLNPLLPDGVRARLEQAAERARRAAQEHAGGPRHAGTGEDMPSHPGEALSALTDAERDAP